jgi:hypothetical protein
MKPLAICLSLWLIVSALASAQDSVESVRDAAMNTALQLRSVSCTTKLPNGSVELYATPNGFRSNVVYTDRMSFEAARNATHFQNLLADNGSLLIGERPIGGVPYGILHPIAMPYMWLSPGDPQEWTITGIRNTLLWQSRFSKARLAGESIVDGRAVIEVDFGSVGSRGDQHSVWFSKSDGYYPIKWERRVGADHKVSTNCVVEDLDRYGDAEKAIVPLRVRYQEFGHDGVSMPEDSTASIQPATLHVNTPIDKSLFTIDRSRATRVFDVDAGRRRNELVKERARSERKDLTLTSSGYNWSLIGNAAVVAVLLVLFALRMWHQKTLRAASK